MPDANERLQRIQEEHDKVYEQVDDDFFEKVIPSPEFAEKIWGKADVVKEKDNKAAVEKKFIEQWQEYISEDMSHDDQYALAMFLDSTLTQIENDKHMTLPRNASECISNYLYLVAEVFENLKTRHIFRYVGCSGPVGMFSHIKRKKKSSKLGKVIDIGVTTHEFRIESRKIRTDVDYDDGFWVAIEDVEERTRLAKEIANDIDVYEFELFLDELDVFDIWVPGGDRTLPEMIEFYAKRLGVISNMDVANWFAYIERDEDGGKQLRLFHSDLVDEDKPLVSAAKNVKFNPDGYIDRRSFVMGWKSPNRLDDGYYVPLYQMKFMRAGSDAQREDDVQSLRLRNGHCMIQPTYFTRIDAPVQMHIFEPVEE